MLLLYGPPSAPSPLKKGGFSKSEKMLYGPPPLITEKFSAEGRKF